MAKETPLVFVFLGRIGIISSTKLRLKVMKHKNKTLGLELCCSLPIPLFFCVYCASGDAQGALAEALQHPFISES